MQKNNTLNIMTRITLRSYSIAFSLLTPLLLLRLLIKSRNCPEYRLRFKERFGFFKPPAERGGIWLHAVSLGEVAVALPIIKQIQAQYPDKRITVTCTTPTGSGKIQRVLGDKVFHVYMPFDMPFALSNFLKRIQPEAVIILETELWPNLLAECLLKKYPVFLANAIISDKAFPRYQKIAFLWKTLFKSFYKICAQSQQDRDRFIALGASCDQVCVTGNIKFDIKQDPSIQEAGFALKNQLGQDRLVFIAASTHAGEEELIVSVFKQAKNHFPSLLLVIVPRHPERFAQVAQLLEKHNLNYVKRSTKVPCTPSTDVFLGDTMGEMGLFYAASDLAFVGGSLVNIGGHNTLEAASAKLPIIVGPYTHKCREIVQLLHRVRALEQISETEALLKVLTKWLNHPESRLESGERGYQVFLENKGALDRFMQAFAY